MRQNLLLMGCFNVIANNVGIVKELIVYNMSETRPRRNAGALLILRRFFYRLYPVLIPQAEN